MLSSLATRSASAHTFTRLRSEAGVTQNSAGECVLKHEHETDECVLKHEHEHATLLLRRFLSPHHSLSAEELSLSLGPQRRGALSHSVHNAVFSSTLARTLLNAARWLGHGLSPRHVRSAPRTALFSSLLHTLLLTLCPFRPLFGRVFSSLRQSGADTPPSLVTVPGYFLHPAKNLGVIVVEAHKTMRNVLPLFPGFGGNSRRSRTIALFARESRAGNLAASPSIPRGMSPHGARWLWVPFDGVCICGGGGAAASLMDVVWRERGI